MAERKQRRTPRKFTDEFKQQIVDLHRAGKRRVDICREYDIVPSLLDRWLVQANTTGSFRDKENRTVEQNELIELRKELRQLRMENDILKQAALIFGRK
jgi:Transposase and inactivated derivatives